MLWVLLIVVIVVILVIKNKSQNNFKFQPPAAPGRTLDPNHVEDACFALAYLLARHKGMMNVFSHRDHVFVSASFDSDVLYGIENDWYPSDISNCAANLIQKTQTSDKGKKIECNFYPSGSYEPYIISDKLEKSVHTGVDAWSKYGPPRSIKIFPHTEKNGDCYFTAAVD